MKGYDMGLNYIIQGHNMKYSFDSEKSFLTKRILSEQDTEYENRDPFQRDRDRIMILSI